MADLNNKIVKSVQRGESWPGVEHQTYLDIAINTVNVYKSIVVSSSAMGSRQSMMYAQLLNASTIRLNTGYGYGNAPVAWQVIEFW